MVYSFEYLEDDLKIDIIKMHLGSNEADIYSFQLQVDQLNLAIVKDDILISEYIQKINDKIAQNQMLINIMEQLAPSSL